MAAAVVQAYRMLGSDLIQVQPIGVSLLPQRHLVVPVTPNPMTGWRPPGLLLHCPLQLRNGRNLFRAAINASEGDGQPQQVTVSVNEPRQQGKALAIYDPGIGSLQPA